MNIKSITEINMFLVESVEGDYYRRVGPHDWEQLYGESWEPNFNDSDLERSFTDYLKKVSTT